MSVFSRIATALWGNTSGAVIPAGFLGEIFQDCLSTNSSIATAGTYQDACSRSLTAGLWRVSWSVTFYNNGATNFTEAIAGIGTASGSSSQDVINSINGIDNYKAAAVNGITFADSINVLVSSTQITVLNGASSGTPTGTARSGSTIYLKVWANDNTSGPVVYRYRMTCTRSA